MVYAVIGSRAFDFYGLMSYILDQHPISAIVSGGAVGADKLSEKYAKENNIPITIFPADWNKYGKSAGYKRNVDIIESCDIVIAFWDGQSKGTWHSIQLAKKLNKHVEIIRYLDYTRSVFF